MHMVEETGQPPQGHVLNTLLRAGPARGSTGNSREWTLLEGTLWWFNFYICS